jgi:predicted ABC-type ATPase
MMPEGQAPLQPTLYIIAGANGSGKSAVTLGAQSMLQVPAIDAGEQARVLNADAPETVLIAAGRLVLERSRAYLVAGEHFALETTLAGNTQFRLMEEAKTKGHNVHLIYIGVESADLCIERVALRVANGGHGVRRRRRAPALWAQYDQPSKGATLGRQRGHSCAAIYDNSTEHGHRQLRSIKHGQVVAQEPVLPHWVTHYLGPFLIWDHSYTSTAGRKRHHNACKVICRTRVRAFTLAFGLCSLWRRARQGWREAGDTLKRLLGFGRE